MSIDETVYAAPESALARPDSAHARSLESAIAGDWDFDIGEVMSEAWRLVAGSKGVIWVGLLIAFAINVVLSMVGGLAAVALPESPEIAMGVSVVFQLGGQAVVWVLTGGLYLYAIKRAADQESASVNDVLSALPLFLPLAGVMFLSTLLTFVGFVLLIIPGIYLAIGYMLALPLKVERGLGIWEALETSRKSIQNHWFKVFGLGLVTAIAVGLGSLITLGIGMIWAWPFFILVYGVLYHRIFGYSGAGSAQG